MARLAQLTEISYNGTKASSNREVLVGTEFITAVQEAASSVQGLTGESFPITGAVAAAGGPFTISGNFQGIITPGEIFEVTGSTGNDGFYTVVTAIDNVADTDITVVETVSSAVADGDIAFKDILVISNENNTVVTRKVAEPVATIRTRVNAASTTNTLKVITESILSIEGQGLSTTGVFPFTRDLAVDDIISVYDSLINPGSDSTMAVYNRLAKIPTIYEVDDALATVLAAANG